MSLPPGFLDELRSRLTLSEVVGRKVTWDRRKSNPGRGDFWAPCPFHQERTPSFHVDDRKGYYYCFGCQAKGDLISFVRETENLSFMEAVERLAGEAGMEVPREPLSPQAAAARDATVRLVEAMEQAVALYGLALRSASGQRARDYVAGRGISPEMAARFELGFAPDSRSHAVEAFRGRGTLDAAVAAGLVIRPEDGGAPYDRFRDRLVFPIRDHRGRCIALGGRALSAEARAKYINSPETALFHKGRTLYNIGPARTAAARTGRLVLAEGYTDVIAFTAAGVEEAVAPLGTAVTEEQLRLAWRLAPEPLVALDGDAAGLKAAGRVIETALPLIGPGRSLGFVLMPGGKDPDEVLRAEGAAALRACLDDPLPMIEMLWRRERDAAPNDTPERRAALHARLMAAAGRIADPLIRGQYERELADRARALSRPATVAAGGGPARPAAGARGRGRRAGGFGMPDGPRVETRGSALARGMAPEAAARGREATILLIALHNPAALAPVLADLEAMPVTVREFERLRDGLAEALHEGGEPLPLLASRLGRDPVGLLAAEPTARAHVLARPGADAARVAAVLADAIAWHAAHCMRESELAEARRDFSEARGEDWTLRLAEAVAAPHLLAQRAFGAEDTVEAGGASPIAEMLARHERGEGRGRAVARDPAKKPGGGTSNQ